MGSIFPNSRIVLQGVRRRSCLKDLISGRRVQHQTGVGNVKRAAIYVRVSTTNRARGGDGFEQNP